MKKILLLISFLSLFFGTIIHARPTALKSKYSNNLQQQIKFGPQIGAGSISNKIGIFSEYKLSETLGIQLSVLYALHVYFMSLPEVYEGNSAFAQTHYISTPVTLRTYPGKNRHFCWFGGVQLGYLITGRFRFKPEEKLNFEKSLRDTINNFENSPDISLKEIDKQNKLQRFQLGVVIGCDYEFESGLILGLSYTKQFIDAIKSKKSYGNWTFQPALGYNFGKLFK